MAIGRHLLSAARDASCLPGFDGEIGRSLPIPQTGDPDEGIWIYTHRGLVQVYESAGRIRGRWNNTDILTSDWCDAGGNVTVTLYSDGQVHVGRE